MENEAATPRRRRVSVHAPEAGPPAPHIPDVADLPLPPAPPEPPRARAKKAEPPTLSNPWQAVALKAAKLAANHAQFTRQTALAYHLGVPSPSLAMSYGLGSNVIPLSRFIHLVGKEGSFKSAFLMDMCRWVLELAENAMPAGEALIADSIQYNENENKPARDYFWSMLEHREAYEGIIEFCESLTADDWIRNMVARVKAWEGLYDPVKGGPGWFMPLILAVDSLVGTAPEDLAEKLLKGGDVDMGFPALAKKLTAFSQLLPQMMGKRPIWLVATNHLKSFTDPKTQMLVDKAPGGQAIKHMESLEFRFSRLKDHQDARLTGARVRIKFHKNCLGDSRRAIEVPIFWCYDIDPDTGLKRQWTMWDWYEASIRFLEELKEARPQLWSQVEPILDLQVTTNGRVSSDALGISNKARLSRHEAGLVLENNAALMDQLLPILGISQGRFFQPGSEFDRERTREDVTFDSMALRPVRRPAAGDLGRFLSEGIDVGPATGFTFDAGY